ncbi:hypothetical protein H0H93_007543 [Arthromyces matolae]|nr:hypothetical protein H0H93_007543 [Arthromyces matolae]
MPTWSIPSTQSTIGKRISSFILRNIAFRLSHWYCLYCEYRGIPLPFQGELGIYPMPFNTLIKCHARVSEREALSMKLAFNLGLPVPRVLLYAENSYGSAIWMTRIHGVPLGEAWTELSLKNRTRIMDELHSCLLRLRECKSPRGEEISSITGGAIRTFRGYKGFIPVCKDKTQLLQFQIAHGLPSFHFDPRVPATYIGFGDRDPTGKIAHLASMPHSVVFAHGDLYFHNILVKDGHLSGIIDWECAGWLPEYWDYAYMLARSFHNPTDWSFAIYDNPAFKYYEELICDSEVVDISIGAWPTDIADLAPI